MCTCVYVCVQDLSPESWNSQKLGRSNPCFPSGSLFVPQGTSRLSQQRGHYWYLAGKSQALLNILQCTRQPLPHNEDNCTENVSGANVDKSCSSPAPSYKTTTEWLTGPDSCLPAPGFHAAMLSAAHGNSVAVSEPSLQLGNMVQSTSPQAQVSVSWKFEYLSVDSEKSW